MPNRVTKQSAADDASGSGEAARKTKRRASAPKRRRFEDDGALTARLTKYGTVLFSLSAVRHFRLTDARLCRLYYDKKRARLGIELVTDKNDLMGCERKVHTTKRSAYVVMTSILRTYGIDAAADTICPVVAEQPNGIDLIAVDLTPAVEAAAGGNVAMPCRPGAGEWHRYKPRSG